MCARCGQGFAARDRRDKHEASAQSLSCGQCGRQFCHDSRLRQHIATVHNGRGVSTSAVSSQPANLNEPIIGYTPYQDRPEYEEVLAQHRSVIRSQEVQGGLWKRINRQIPPDFSYGDLKILLNGIMTRAVSAFKINIGFGVVLYNIVHQDFRYYYVSTNQLLFDRAFTISKRLDVLKFFDKIKDLNLAERFFFQRPNSSWVLAGVPNVEIRIFRLPRVQIGASEIVLPDYIKNSSSIKCLTHRRGKKKFPYNDRLCLFRCMALFLGHNVDALERPSLELKAQLEEYTGKDFTEGVEMTDLPEVEEFFDVGINVYSLVAKKVAKLIRQTEKETDKIVHLNLYGNHFSYITKFKSFADKMECTACGIFMKHTQHLARHKTRCKAGKVQEIFVGGKYMVAKTVFQLLEELGIDVPEEDRYDGFFSTFDFEAFAVPIETEYLGRQFHAEHVPATFSVCSSVPGHERAVHCRTTGNAQELVDALVKALLRHQKTRSELMTRKYQPFLEKLDQLKNDLMIKLGKEIEGEQDEEGH